MSGYNDPKLLYAINNINAYHIENGKEECLTPSGPQTLSLLMVPTSSPFPDHSVNPQDQSSEEDFYLHLHLPPELDLPLPATTQIYFQPPSSYLIPRAWDLGPDRGAFTRIEFPSVASGGSQDDIDTFETIIAQCTAFLERAAPPKPPRHEKSRSPKSSRGLEDEPIPAYDPSAFKPGEGYVQGSSSSVHEGQIVLVDEENGSVVGELGEGFHVVEDRKMKAGSKEPVVITLPEDGSLNIGVAPASKQQIEKAIHPAYKDSTLVTKAAAASHLIIASSDYVSKSLQSHANNFTQTTKPNVKPMTFTPTTQERIRKVHTFSSGAAGVSSKVVGHVSKYAQNVGATVLKRTNQSGIGPDGKLKEGYKPGLLNKSLMAFSTIADGVEHAGINLLSSSSSAASTVVAHKYGEQAGEVSKGIGGNVKNVALVYIDVTGVSRKAIVKAVAKGMVVGKVSDGSQLIVSGSEDPPSSSSSSRPASPAPGVVSPPSRIPSALDKPKSKPMNWKEREAAEGRYTDDAAMVSGGKGSSSNSAKGRLPPPPPPPPYGSSIGEVVDETKFSPDSKETWG